MRLRTMVALAGAGLLVSWALDEVKRSGAAARRKASGDGVSEQDRDDELTSAIENTFPASDPYQVSSPTAHEAGRSPYRRPAAIDPASVQRQVELLERKRAGRGV